MNNPIRTIIDPITGQQFERSADWNVEQKRLRLRYPAAGFEAAYLQKLPPVGIDLGDLSWQVKAHQTKDEIKPLKGVKNIIAIASGKGGVGKSTVSVMLAKALQQLGASVGILDTDIYGPSIPKMLGSKQQPQTPDDKHFLPVIADDIKSMSIGYILDEKTPAIWRGAMVSKALMQMTQDTLWGELDYLVLDLPPGTGDIQLTIIQKIAVTAAVLVTTPQDIALIDAQKALAMFQKVNTPVLGIIENMSGYQCEHCGHRNDIFGRDGGVNMATDFNVPFLGKIPLSIEIRKKMDRGEPNIWQENQDLQQNTQIIALKTVQNLAKLPIKFSLSEGLKLNL